MYKSPPNSVLPSENKVPSAILENTIEQTILAFGALTILDTVLRGPELVLIPLLVVIYVIGRLTFSPAYRRSKALARLWDGAYRGSY